MKKPQPKPQSYSYRLIFGSLLGLLGVILLFVSIFIDWRLVVASAAVIIIGAIIAGLRNLREFISNILSAI